MLSALTAYMYEATISCHAGQFYVPGDGVTIADVCRLPGSVECKKIQG